MTDDAKKDTKKEDKKDDKKETPKVAATVIDPRAWPAASSPVAGIEADNWFRLEAVEGGFLLLRKDEPEFSKYQKVDDHTGGKLELVKYDLKEAETSDILPGHRQLPPERRRQEADLPRRRQVRRRGRRQGRQGGRRQPSIRAR